MLRALSAIGYIGMVGGLIGLLITRSLLSPSPLVIVPQVAALGLMFWARITFGRRSFHLMANPTEGGLVTNGPYRYIRHPIYTAVCLFVTPAVVAHLSWLSLLFGGLIWVAVLARIFCEERLVCARYPEYRQYASTTARMFPFVF